MQISAQGVKQSILGLTLMALGSVASVSAAPSMSSVTTITSSSVGTSGVTSPTYLYQYAQQQQQSEANIQALTNKCNEGDAVACKSLGYTNVRNYHQQHNVELIQRGFAFFERGCALRDGESCYLRGLTLIEAQQHGLDLQKVFRINNVEHMLESSLLEGSKLSNTKQASDAFAYLAEIYQNKDHEKTVMYARQGCELNNNDACYLMGISMWLMQIEGSDISEYLDGRDAFDVLIPAFKKGTQANRLDYCSNSYYFLGYEYARKQMYDFSTESYQKGCELNNDNACFFTGIAYEDGLGVHKNIQKAYGFYNKACSLGSSYGCERVRKLNLQGIH